MTKPAFYGFLREDECRVELCFTPSAPRFDGVYATAYYTTPPYDQLACMMWTDSHGWMARARHLNAKYHAAPDRSLDGAVRAALAAAPTVDDCGDLF